MSCKHTRIEIPLTSGHLLKPPDWNLRLTGHHGFQSNGFKSGITWSWSNLIAFCCRKLALFHAASWNHQIGIQALLGPSSSTGTHIWDQNGFPVHPLTAEKKSHLSEGSHMLFPFLWLVQQWSLQAICRGASVLMVNAVLSYYFVVHRCNRRSRPTELRPLGPDTGLYFHSFHSRLPI